MFAREGFDLSDLSPQHNGREYQAGLRTLIGVAHALYVATGGTATLGMTGGTLARLLLSAIVLGVPTFLMGGTLPAAARAVERASDTGRRDLGVLYAVNTLGAVSGAVWANFASIEIFGVRNTLFIAALLNALVAMIARRMSQGQNQIAEEAAPPSPAAVAVPAPVAPAAVAPPAFVYAAAASSAMLSPSANGSRKQAASSAQVPAKAARVTRRSRAPRP